MARILFVNSVCYGSTGTICKNLYKLAEEAGHECCFAYGRGEAPKGLKSIRIGSNVDVYMHAVKARVLDASGWGSKAATQKFVEWLEEYRPEIIHMHNLHGYYLNLEVFFSYLKRHPEIKKIWTLHDCWSFTGHCAHYLTSRCDKWQEQCSACPCLNEYPKSFKDASIYNFEQKKRLFTNLENLVIACVSEWLMDEVKKSFLKKQDAMVITSGIDTHIFHYQENDFKQKYHMSDKKMILGVAQSWTDAKGLGDFIELEKRLTDDYQIVLVGLTAKQIEKIPKSIIGIEKTENQMELAKLYSAADVYFNPTKAETFGLTNIEAQACGTMVCSYDAGGTRETIINENAYLVENLDEFINVVENNIGTRITKNNKVRESFDRNMKFLKYLNLYGEIMN